MRSYAVVLPIAGGQQQLAARNVSTQIGRREFLHWGTGLLAAAALTGRSRSAEAATANRPSTSRASREQALQQMPLQSLQEPMRGRIERIVSKPTIYRRLPLEVIPCDPELYLFLVRYPEVVVNMWQLMGVTRARIKRTSAYTYDAEDGAGTCTQVELVYGTRDLHLFLAEGYYEGPLLPRRITGRCTLLLTSAYSQDEQQHSYVSNRLDMFLQLDKVGAELVAKTLHPLMGKTIDTNFSESARFVSQVSHVARTNGPGVARLVTRLDKVEPDVRLRFAQITTAVNQRAALQNLANPEQDPWHRITDLGTDRPPGAISQ